MAKSTLVGELLHFHAIRFRVTGSGSLRSTLVSLSNVNSSILNNISMSITNREPLVLANFIEQRGYLRIQTTAIDEYFTISKIIIFMKPIAASFPM